MNFRTLLLVLLFPLLILLVVFFPYVAIYVGGICNIPVRNAYVKKTTQEILVLASDPNATRKRVNAIKASTDGMWSDGRVGVTGDGYVFFYDIHESHGSDRIDDVELFYLPDEKQFIESPKHFCCDLVKLAQPANKAALLKVISSE
ncbi:MAG: hypothetical protein ACYDCO_18155 [Armatimonadota bacterium]